QEKSVATLVEGDVAFRDGSSVDRPQCALRNADELRVGDAKQAGVASQQWEIGATRNFFRPFLLFDFEPSDANDVIMLERELDCFIQSDVTRSCARLGFLSMNSDAGSGKKNSNREAA